MVFVVKTLSTNILPVTFEHHPHTSHPHAHLTPTHAHLTPTRTQLSCSWCMQMTRRVLGSGRVVYENGDRTDTISHGSRCGCGYMHYWDGKEYDNLPEKLVIVSYRPYSILYHNNTNQIYLFLDSHHVTLVLLIQFNLFGAIIWRLRYLTEIGKFYLIPILASS